jgi:hypothetical protein
MEFNPFDIQEEILLDAIAKEHRYKFLFAAKRGGKSETCYVETVIKGQKKIGFLDDGDPYLMAIVAPTQDMLTRLVWPKFRMFAKKYEKRFVSKPDIFEFKNGSIVYGISAEKINRMEGLKLYHVHLTEAFQMKQTSLLESMARTLDTKGTITVDGSLGPQLINPKQHWLYKMVKAQEFKNSKVWEWATLDNPYIDKEEIETQREILDPVTFRANYEITWDTIPTNAVYDSFSDDNVMQTYTYNPLLPTYVAIDWGWSHPMAAGFFQVDNATNTVYLFDEIVSSKLKIERLHKQILAKPYKINGWCCDIAGNQEREQTGMSNINWFKTKNIHMKHRRTAVTYGIPILRSYIRNGKDEVKFYISASCVKSIDGMRQYRYKEKDGVILNENPLKENDDAVDMIRYFFLNYMDKNLTPSNVKMLAR